MERVNLIQGNGYSRGAWEGTGTNCTALGLVLLNVLTRTPTPSGAFSLLGSPKSGYVANSYTEFHFLSFAFFHFSFSFYFHWPHNPPNFFLPKPDALCLILSKYFFQVFEEKVHFSNSHLKSLPPFPLLLQGPTFSLSFVPAHHLGCVSSPRSLPFQGESVI